MSGDVYNLKDTEIRGRAFVQQEAYLYKNLTVAGQTFVKDLSVTGFFSANYPSESIPASAIAGINNFAADVTMNNGLAVGGNILTNSSLLVNNAVTTTRLFVNNDANIRQRLFVDNDATLKKRMFVTGTAEFMNDVSINGNLIINGGISMNYLPNTIPSNAIIDRNVFDTDLSVNNRLFVAKTAEFSKNVTMKENLNVNAQLTVKDISITGNLAFNNFANGSILPSSISGGVLPANTFNNDVSLSERLFVTKAITTRDNLNVERDASFNRSINVGGNVNIANTLTVKDVNISGNLTANFANASIQPSSISGGVLPANTFNNDVSLSERLFVTKAITTKDNLNVERDASFNRTMRVGGAVTLGNTLAVVENATFAKDVTISGNLNANFANASIQPSSISGGVLPANTFNNDVSLSERLFVTKAITTKDNLNVERDASFNRTMRVSGAVTLGNTLAVVENATFAKDVTVSGNLTANFANASIQPSSISGGVLPSNTFNNDVSLTQRLFVTNAMTTRDNLNVERDASFNRTMRVGGGVTLGNTLAVAENASFAKDVTVSGNLNANFANASIPPSSISGGVLPANTFNNDVSLSERLFVTNPITAKNNLIVERDASFNRVMKVGGSVTLGNTLAVAENASFAKDLTVSGNLIANFANGSIPSIAISGGTLPANTLENDVRFLQKIITMNDASFNKKMNV